VSVFAKALSISSELSDTYNVDRKHLKTCALPITGNIHSILYIVEVTVLKFYASRTIMEQLPRLWVINLFYVLSTGFGVVCYNIHIVVMEVFAVI